ncbi:MAG: IclR family transcriptional regulator [Solirubrobacteraceae bacterium]
MSVKPVRPGIQTIERAATILRLLSGGSRRLGVAELARELAVPKGTVHGILRTLALVGFVEQHNDSGKYQLSAGLLPLGFSYLEANELRMGALNATHSLAMQSGESVRVGTLHEHQVLVVHHVSRPDDSRRALEVGSLMPAHATALGKALLAPHRELVTEFVGADLPRYTPATVTAIRRLLGELDDVSERGWGCEVGELVPGIASIAAPIEDRELVKIGAIGIEGSIERICQDGSPRAELVAHVIESARSASRELGATRWAG